ncbi:hypothetical protein VZ95_19740 [Elstera litoralis]|uniref:Uncharacterized protein n=1 Tax=Elstera litoralis TaxID=552518 RepID=A0A0F3IMI3_9PROT|nr:hypothetical protein VZ95_19740 [Elstera litoralis]
MIFLEIAARPPGAEIIRSYNTAFGIDLPITLLELEIGIKSIPSPRFSRGSGWAYFPRSAGVVGTLTPPVLRSEMQIVEWKVAPGDFIERTTCGHERSGSVCFSDNSFSVVYQDANYLLSFDPVTLRAL